MKLFFTIILILIFGISAGNSKSISGCWSGKIIIPPVKIGIVVNFTETTDSITGTIDIPQQSARGLKLTNIVKTGDSLFFELVVAAGNVARFSGCFAADSIAGKFTQMGITGKFYLIPDSSALKKNALDSASMANLPYKSEEITFYSDSLKFAGTLTIPYGDMKFPAVVLITGSGQQNRDEDIFGFKVFGIIADYLTKSGIAVLRYDDRGIGGSDAGDLMAATTMDFARDSRFAFEYLKKRSEVDSARVGLFGHSEGGIIATMLAAQYSDIAFIVMMAGSAIRGDTLLFEQAKALMSAENADSSDIQKQLSLQQKIFTAIRTDSGWDEIRTTLYDLALESYNKLSDEEKKEFGNFDETVEPRIDAQLRQSRSPWLKFFIDYDPVASLKNVKCPVLALFGEKDLQVPAELNSERFSQAMGAAGNKNFKTLIILSANHLFQEAKTGSVSEYSELKQEFAPGFLETISLWIKEQYENPRK